MKVVRSNKKSYLIIMFFMILSLFLLCSKNTDIETKLEQVELSNKESVLPKDLFAIMISDEDGNYSESTSNTFPSSGYTFNAELSGCIDAKGSLVEGIMTFENNLVTVSTDTTVYCYLYFDIIVDTEPPTNNSVSINNGDSYTTSASVTLILSSTDVAEMCISNTDSCSNWEPYATSKSWTLTTGDGTKTVYVWFRDEYGNTSEYVTDTITLDTAAPTSNSVKINNNATYTTSTSVTLTLSSGGANEMCISNTTECSNWVTYATSKAHTLISGAGTKTVYAWFKDAAGNTTSYVSDSIILDTTYPTVTASSSSNNTTSPKISITSNEAGTYCVNTSSTRTSFSSCTLTGSISANTALTTSALSSSGTYYVHVKDSAGNIGVSSAISITKMVTISEHIKTNESSGYNSTLQGGLYRFQGTNPNNYICFGTSTKSTCTGNTDAYMYRIIGINSSGQVKLIKKEALNSTMKWYSSSTSNIAWPSSTIYSSINGSSFYTNTTYVPTSWQSKIATYSWKYGDNTNINVTAATLYNTENAWSSTINAKIGLMYAHDYYYAYQSGGLNCSSSGSYSTCKTSWLYLTNCDSNAPSTYEWIMSRYGVLDDEYLAMLIYHNGSVTYSGLSLNNSVRPVFYLTTSVNFVSGTGTASDPFIIS